MSWESGLRSIASELKRKYPKRTLEVIELCAKIESMINAKEAKWAVSVHKEKTEAKTQ